MHDKERSNSGAIGSVVLREDFPCSAEFAVLLEGYESLNSKLYNITAALNTKVVALMGSFPVPASNDSVVAPPIAKESWVDDMQAIRSNCLHSVEDLEEIVSRL